jgi:hypothetical protein
MSSIVVMTLTSASVKGRVLQGNESLQNDLVVGSLLDEMHHVIPVLLHCHRLTPGHLGQPAPVGPQNRSYSPLSRFVLNMNLPAVHFSAASA